MAKPMTADEFLAALRAEGVRITEHPGWRDHNREGHGPWGPVNGVMIHHTGGVAPSDGHIVWAARPHLPGPCAHGYLAKTGVVTMTANGRANHAGGGSAAVLAAVVAETALPATHDHEGSPGAVDGNSHFYGLEISNRGDGKEPYPAVQYDAAVRWAAAICRHHGWSTRSVIGHKEWSDWKPDPSFDIATFRDSVAARLAHPANWDSAATTPPPARQETDDMDLTTAQLIAIGKEAAHQVAIREWTDPVTGRPTMLGTLIAKSSTLERTVAAQGAAIQTLAAKVGSGDDTAAVVAAVQKAIAAAVVHVDVDVTGPTQSAT
jgi:hypothetical protein